MDARAATAKIRRLGLESGVRASIVTDGATIDLSEAARSRTASAKRRRSEPTPKVSRPSRQS
jgi:hypothetical protein